MDESLDCITGVRSGGEGVDLQIRSLEPRVISREVLGDCSLGRIRQKPEFLSVSIERRR